MVDELDLADLLLAVPPGGVAGQAIGWNPDLWLARAELNRWRHVIERLATAGDITRAEVHQYADADATSLLVAAMVWGFGPLGYGPARVAEMVSRPRTAETLDGVLDTMRREVRRSPAGGFTAVFARRRPKLPWLGTAYATKFLHFAENGRGPRRALVYDKRVWRTLQQLRQYPSNPEAAEHYGCVPEDIEYAAFVANGSLPA